jgi:hypothetical protein
MLTRASGVSRGRGTEAEWAADSVFTSPSRRHCASSSRDCQHTWAMNASAPWCLPACLDIPDVHPALLLSACASGDAALITAWRHPFFLSLWTRHSTQSSAAPDCFLFLIDYMGMWEKRGGSGTAKHVTFHLEQSSPPELPACVPSKLDRKGIASHAHYIHSARRKTTNRPWWIMLIFGFRGSGCHVDIAS